MLKFKRKTLQSFGKNILLFVVMVLAVEYWQSRGMIRGALPDHLRDSPLPTLTGATQSLWSPERFSVIYVFAPWCGVCRVSGGNIDRLPDGFQKTALALSWEQPAEVARFVEETGLQVPVLMGQGAEESGLRISSYPSYFILDTQGNIVRAWSGYTTTFGLWVRSYWTRLWAARG